MTRSQWQTLAELDEILTKAARLTDKSYSINLPHDKGGNLSMNESIELLKKRSSKQFIDNLLNNNPNWKVLDIGCGYTAHKSATVICDVQDLSKF